MLKADAGITELMVIHHMGHAGERSRGASRLRDWPDAEWRLVRERPDTKGEEPPPDAARFFAAEGRDVAVRETRLTYDLETRRLSVAGGNRVQHKATKDMPAMLAIITDKPGLKSNELEARGKFTGRHLPGPDQGRDHRLDRGRPGAYRARPEERDAALPDPRTGPGPMTACSRTPSRAMTSSSRVRGCSRLFADRELEGQFASSRRPICRVLAHPFSTWSREGDMTMTTTTPPFTPCPFPGLPGATLRDGTCAYLAERMDPSPAHPRTTVARSRGPSSTTTRRRTSHDPHRSPATAGALAVHRRPGGEAFRVPPTGCRTRTLVSRPSQP